MKQRYAYPAVFAQAAGAKSIITFPDLGISTEAAGNDTALISAIESLECAIIVMSSRGEKLPDPTPIENIKANDNERVMLIEAYVLV